MMAVSALMAASNNPNDIAIANGIASPLVTAPSTSARAMPIDTAVTATAVDNASAAQRVEVREGQVAHGVSLARAAQVTPPTVPSAPFTSYDGRRGCG